VKWERIDRQRVYSGRVVDVARDTICITTGDHTRQTIFDVVRHPGAAAIVPLFDDDTVALINQFRYAVGKRIWEIPAGSLGDGESFETCAERELKEEVGYRAQRWTPLAAFYTTPGFCDEELRVFLAEGLIPGTTNHEDDEDIDVTRIPLEQALEWATSGQIRDAKSMLGLWAARDHLRAADRWPSTHGA
jgi:ADP-ribose pyrophosphatase